MIGVLLAANLWLPAGIYGAGQGADVYQTCRLEARGAVETNRVVGQGCGGRLFALKGATAAAFTLVDLKFQKHHKGLSWTLRSVHTAMQVWVLERSGRRRR